MSESLSDENLSIYKYITNLFGGKASSKASNEAGSGANLYGFDIITCRDTPIEKVNSYSTLALSDYFIGKDKNNISLGVELLGACGSKNDRFDAIIDSCAFTILTNHLFCPPGTILENMVQKHYPESSMKHVLLHNPFGWDQEVETLYFPSKTVVWLLCVPISIAECDYAKQLGVNSLNARFEKEQIDIYNLDRNSII
jgi:antitoxin YqcF